MTGGTRTKILGGSSGRIVDTASWWWSKKVQDYMQRTRLAKKKWDNERTGERRQVCRDMQREGRGGQGQTKGVR